MKNFFFILLITPFISLAQGVDCIDSTAINPDCSCFEIYEPVLGCNGITYSNECFAACDGVQNWEYLNLGGGDVCDFIDIDIVSSNNQVIIFEYETYFDQAQGFSYAGFVLLNVLGDTIAIENIETALNVYGIYGGMSGIINLESYNIGYELPLEAELHLVENYFAGNQESVCSISLEILQGPSENDTLELSGQWYSNEDEEYIEFNADTIYIYSFEDDLECYDFESAAYQANDSILFVYEEGELSISVSYSLSDTQFVLSFDEDSLVFDVQSFDPSKFDICEEQSFNCSPNGCISISSNDIIEGEFDDLEDCEWECEKGQSFDCTPDGCISLSSFEGEFVDLGDCEFECVQEQFQSWNCIDGNCEMLNDSSGTYNTYQSCVDVCSVTDLTDYQLSKKVIKVTDLLGREISPNSDQIIILYYDDGSIEKKYFLKK